MTRQADRRNPPVRVPGARQIEAEIEQDRAKLALTLTALQDRMTPDVLVQDGLGLLRKTVKRSSGSMDSAVRSNPLALAVVGAGLAWLVFGGRKPLAPKRESPEAMSGWEDDGGPARPSDEPDDSWKQNSVDLRQQTAAAHSRIDRDARDAAQDERDLASGREPVLAALTLGLRRQLHRGLEGLAAVAQDRIATARTASAAGRVPLQHMGASRPRAAGRLIEDHPLVLGVVTFAIGAALGRALPRTGVEDRSFGAERDRLMTQASRRFAAERKSMMQAATDIGADLAFDALGLLMAPVTRAADNGRPREE